MRRLLSREPGICPVCQFVARSMAEHVDHLFFERVTDIQTRADIRAAKGFCRLHARLVSQQGDALGTALIMQDILVNELRALDAGKLGGPHTGGGLFSRFFAGDDSTAGTHRTCPLCQIEVETERLTVDSLLAALPDEGFATAIRASRGLCLPHFHLAAGRHRDARTWNSLVEVQKRALTELADELGELARKSDYRFSSEAIGAEGDSWRRALEVTSGRTGPPNGTTRSQM